MQADPHSVHYETRRPIHMYPYPYPYILHSSMCWPNNKRFTLLSRWNAGYAKCGNKWSKRAINLLHHHGFGSSVALQPLVCSVFAGRLWNGLWIDWEMNPSLAALSPESRDIQTWSWTTLFHCGDRFVIVPYKEPPSTALSPTGSWTSMSLLGNWIRMRDADAFLT